MAFLAHGPGSRSRSEASSQAAEKHPLQGAHVLFPSVIAHETPQLAHGSGRMDQRDKQALWCFNYAAQTAPEEGI